MVQQTYNQEKIFGDVVSYCIVVGYNPFCLHFYYSRYSTRFNYFPIDFFTCECWNGMWRFD